MKKLLLQVFLVLLILLNGSALGAGSGSGVTLSGASLRAVGPDLFDAGAGVFTSGTYGWVAQGTNLIANDANTLKITYVDHSAGANLTLRDSTDLSADLVSGTLYKIKFDAKVGAGDSVNVTYRQGAPPFNVLGRATVTNTEFQTFSLYGVANAIYGAFRQEGMDSGEIIWLDNITIQTFD